ncbi:MAG: flagellin [Phaeospirillum sp.]|nr:flagellin [Phaeospirillum sp.]
MALSPIALTSSILPSLQTNQALADRNLQRLTTGRSVNSQADNAQAFTLAQGLLERSGTLSAVGASIGQSVGALQAASAGTSAIAGVINQMKGLAQQALSSSDTVQQANLQGQFNTLAHQIDAIAADSSYNGVNLISASPGSVAIPGLSPGTTATVPGTASDSSSLGIGAAAGWSGGAASIQASLDTLDQASRTLRNQAAELGGNATLLQIRAGFVQAQGAIATSGAGKLTNADANEAAVNAQSANTYRQLGLAALRNAGQSQEAVLGLFTRR